MPRLLVRLLAGGTLTLAGLALLGGAAGADTIDPLSVSASVAADGTTTLTVDFSALAPAATTEVLLTDATGATVSDDTVTSTTDTMTGLTAGTYTLTVQNDTATASDTVTVNDDGSVTIGAVDGGTTVAYQGLVVNANGDGTDTVEVDFGVLDTTADIVITLTSVDGTVLDSQTVSSDQSSVTFTVPTADAYSALVTYTDANGQSQTDVYTSVLPVDGPVIPVDQPGVVVDPTMVTVTANPDGGWTVSWPEPDTTENGVGWFVVTEDNGTDSTVSCEASGTGVVGAIDSCTLDDPATTPPVVTVTYITPRIFDARNVPTTTVAPPVVMYDAVSALGHVPPNQKVTKKSHALRAASETTGWSALLWTASGLLVLGGGVVAIRRPRRRPTAP
jgi:hypothetical protein